MRKKKGIKYFLGHLWGTERNGLTMDSTKRRISPLFIGVSER